LGGQLDGVLFNIPPKNDIGTTDELISEQKLYKIYQQAISATLCKGGFVSTFPHKVVFWGSPSDR
jgi:hypothetical protein